MLRLVCKLQCKLQIELCALNAFLSNERGIGCRDEQFCRTYFQNGCDVWLYPISEIVCNLLGNTNLRNIVLYHTIDWKNTGAVKVAEENR